MGFSLENFQKMTFDRKYRSWVGGSKRIQSEQKEAMNSFPVQMLGAGTEKFNNLSCKILGYNNDYDSCGRLQKFTISVMIISLYFHVICILNYFREHVITT